MNERAIGRISYGGENGWLLATDNDPSNPVSWMTVAFDADETDLDSDDAEAYWTNPDTNRTYSTCDVRIGR